jgi:hypothetical protein
MKLELINEYFLLTNGFIKTKGQFGEYYYHHEYQLFRCWFHNEELQIGKKDIEKDICLWIATLDDRNDFKELFRILTKENICGFNNSKNDLESNGYSFEMGV